MGETSSNGVAVGFARPQSVVVRPPSSVRRPGPSVVNELPKEGVTATAASVVLLFQPPSLSVSITPPPSGMVVYVLRPDRIVVCFRREGRTKEEGLVCSAMLCSALMAVASMS